MASDDGYICFGDVAYVKDPTQRSDQPQIMFACKQKGVTFKFNWSSMHSKTEVETYKCGMCTIPVLVRKGRFVIDNPELVAHPEWCVEKQRTSDGDRANVPTERGDVARLAISDGNEYLQESEASLLDINALPEYEASNPEPQKKRRLDRIISRIISNVDVTRRPSDLGVQQSSQSVGDSTILSEVLAVLGKTGVLSVESVPGKRELQGNAEYGTDLRPEPMSELTEDSLIYATAQSEQRMRDHGAIYAPSDDTVDGSDMSCEEVGNSSIQLSDGDVDPVESVEGIEEIPSYIFEVTDIRREPIDVEERPPLERLRDEADTLFRWKMADLQRAGYSEEQAAQRLLHLISLPERIKAVIGAARNSDELVHYRLQGWMSELPPHESEPEANVLAHLNGIFLVTKTWNRDPEVGDGKYPFIEFNIIDKQCDKGHFYYCLVLFRRQLGELSQADCLFIEVSSLSTTAGAIVRLFDEDFPFARNTLITVDLWPLECSLYQISEVLDKLEQEDALMDFSTEMVRAFNYPTLHDETPNRRVDLASLDDRPLESGNTILNMARGSSDAMTAEKHHYAPTRKEISVLSENPILNSGLEMLDMDDDGQYTQQPGVAGPSTTRGHTGNNNQQAVGMTSEDGYTYFGDVVYFKDPRQRSDHPQILFGSKANGVTFKFRWSSTHAKTEVESYKCTVCSKSVRVRRGRFVTDNPELVAHPEWCVEKRRAHGRVQEEAARDPPLDALLNNLSVETAKAAASITREHLPGQKFNELIFNDENHPFYNIPWMLVLTKEDIRRLERRSGIEAYLSDRIVQFFLTYLAAESAVRTVVVSPQFTAFNHKVGDGSNASLTTTGARRDFLLALIPIQRADHWTLAIYDMRIPHGPVVFYFDPLHRPLTEEIRNVIDSSLWTVQLDGERLQADIRNASNPKEMTPINTQLDSVNCGVHVCLIAQLYVLHDRQTFEVNLNIWRFRRQICDVCKVIRGSILLHFGVIDDIG